METKRKQSKNKAYRTETTRQRGNALYWALKNLQRSERRGVPRGTIETLSCLPATANMLVVADKLLTKTPKGNMRGLITHNLIMTTLRYAIIRVSSSMHG